ncbi:hypothetical protein HG421_01250 [Xanthomonas campestris pv. badrii]|uniref:Uncharacterized protein n=1 Tax=Xanthomonas campestris pv. badrii TaxID=149696 RepID=A0A7Z2V7V1_XANCA|nr:hypothetical protein [Xanthomonas campestris]QJD66483.1 hypothetical protein HG421_01250 [Xanthomonas campestris pv. badrii]
MHFDLHIARSIPSAVLPVSMHGTPDPDTDDDEIPLEEQPPQKGGLRDEVGELDRDDGGALPGRAGGGLAGG